jgi:lipoprotein-anchoring transpeptidase ErfK/SrfK
VQKTEIKTLIFWLFYCLCCLILGAVFSFSLSAGKIKGIVPVVSFKNSQTILPDGEIKVEFDRPVRKEEIEKSFKTTPSVPGNLVWKNDLFGFSFIPKEVFQEDQKYLVAFFGMNKWFIPFGGEWEFKTGSLPKIERVSPFKGQGVKNDEKIFVRFDRPVQNYEAIFKLTPETDLGIIKSDDNQEFVLVPRPELKSATKYQLEVSLRYKSSKENNNEKVVGNLEFSTFDPLQLTGSLPVNGSKNVIFNQKISLSFNWPVDLEKFREYLTVSPESLFKLEQSADGKTIFIKPEGLKHETDYEIKIRKGLATKEGGYLEEDAVVAFRVGILGSVVSLTARATEDPAVKEGKFIDVNLTRQLLDIYSSGVVLGTYRISSGKSGMRTPTGRFTILTKERRHWSRQYKLWMPYSMQFTSAGHFLHELPEWPNGYKEGANHLGIPVSHGCVRLGVGPAETVFNFGDIGTPIKVHY